MSTAKEAMDYHGQKNVNAAWETDSQRTSFSPTAYRKRGHAKVLQGPESFAKHNTESFHSVHKL